MEKSTFTNQFKIGDIVKLVDNKIFDWEKHAPHFKWKEGDIGVIYKLLSNDAVAADDEVLFQYEVMMQDGSLVFAHDGEFWHAYKMPFHLELVEAGSEAPIVKLNKKIKSKK